MQRLPLSRPRWFDAAMLERLRPAFFASVDYLLVFALLFCYAVAQTVSWTLPLQMLAVGLGFEAAFLALIVSGYSRRWRDPALTVWQVAAACAFNLIGMLLAPHIGYVFVVNLFVPLAYGSLHFSQRMYVLAWLCLAAAFGGVILAIDPFPGIAATTPTERVLFWTVVAMTLGRFLAINAEVSRLRHRLQQQNEDLTAAGMKLAELASRDELTGLWNRREFMRLLRNESRRAQRSRSGFCIALFDIDHFKSVNDNFGHLAGDAVLRQLAQILEATRRATDTLARYGGEEFILLVSDASLDTAVHALERSRQQVEQYDWTPIAAGLALTVSAGVAAWAPGESLAHVIERADTALYEAKRAGRNCVRIG